MIQAFVRASTQSAGMYAIRFGLLHQVPEPGVAVLLLVGGLLLLSRVTGVRCQVSGVRFPAAMRLTAVLTAVT
jgi:hypothetical protein